MKKLDSSLSDKVVLQSADRGESMLLAYEAFSGLSKNGVKLRLQYMLAHLHHDWCLTVELPTALLPAAGERCLEHAEQSAHKKELRRMGLFLINISMEPPIAA